MRASAALPDTRISTAPPLWRAPRSRWTPHLRSLNQPGCRARAATPPRRYSESCYSRFSARERATRDALLQVRLNVLQLLVPEGKTPAVVTAMSAAVQPSLSVIALPARTAIIDSITAAHTTHLPMTFKDMGGSEVRSAFDTRWLRL